jgi:hypothetical protein
MDVHQLDRLVGFGEFFLGVLGVDRPQGLLVLLEKVLEKLEFPQLYQQVVVYQLVFFGSARILAFVSLEVKAELLAQRAIAHVHGLERHFQYSLLC